MLSFSLNSFLNVDDIKGVQLLHCIWVISVPHWTCLCDWPACHGVGGRNHLALFSSWTTSTSCNCNSLYLGLQHSSLYRLQLVQIAAARLLTGTRKYDHITPVLANLHWLPVKYCIHAKILLLTFKILNNLAPSYLTELLRLYNPRRALSSSCQMLLEQPRSRLKSRGDRAFVIAAPTLIYNLP